MKAKNMQYWGRELGMCWQRIIEAIFEDNPEFKPALRIGQDEPCDLRIGNLAVDTKYRVGSGDSGTLKKFKQYGPLLKEKGYTPIMLFLRKDNLISAMTALKKGGWEIYQEEESFRFIKEKSGFDLKNWLIKNKNQFSIL